MMSRMPAHRGKTFARMTEDPNRTLPRTQVRTLAIPTAIWPPRNISRKSLGASAAMTGTKVTSLLKIHEVRLVPMMMEAGERILLYFTLVLLPLIYPLKKVLGNKLYSALAVLVFSGLCVVLAQVLHASIVAGYVFFISMNRHWASLAQPAAVFVIVAGNWLIAFAEMYRVAKVAGK